MILPRQLHLGFGAFARAHVLRVIEAARQTSPDEMSDWGVIVARLNSGVGELDALDKAAGRYHVLEVDADRATPVPITCVAGSLHPARDGDEAIPAMIANPELRLITLTITEKGYHPDQPAPQVLLRGLRERRAQGLGGLTLLSCDNLPENGARLAKVIGDLARADDPDLADWIQIECRFPCSMVDRIVPAMTEAGYAELAETLGQSDPNGVLCEPFLQWVIEDDFAAPRPPLDAGGAQFTADIRPFEMMKLRMLNAAHTFLAHMGGLQGLPTIDACMREPALREAAQRLMLAEATPTLPPLPEIDLDAYAAALLARFENPRLAHRCTQIATDTSQKLPQRVLAPISWHIEHGSDAPLMTLCIAAWARWIERDDLPLSDPLAKQLKSCVSNGQIDLNALLAIKSVFPSELTTRQTVRTAIVRNLTALREQGVPSALTDIWAQPPQKVPQ